MAILLAGSGIGDRDGTAFGVPTLAQLAGRLADAGILAVRYDKRGYGQSGGRAESATLNDYAEDARAVVQVAGGTQGRGSQADCGGGPLGRRVGRHAGGFARGQDRGGRHAGRRRLDGRRADPRAAADARSSSRR